MSAAVLPLFASSQLTADAEAALPPLSANIFQRIIRDPRPDSAQARERECTEMLAAVLINAATLRQHIIRWMACESGLNWESIEGLEFEIQTEQFIGSKRDDLRVTGWRHRDEDKAPIVIWTVEVKVGATFHESRLQRLGGAANDVGTSSDASEKEVKLEEEVVNQLRNYDDWLIEQQAKHCAGFVLSLRDVSSAVSTLGLKCRWQCLSWTKLGIQIQRVIKSKVLSAEEVLLARHLLGFIMLNLWRSSEMPDAKLDFNDIALIRAFAVVGTECAEKTSRLTAVLVPILERSGVGFGKPVVQELLFKSSARSMAYRYLVNGLDDDPHPSVSVGIGYESGVGDYMGVIVEVGPRQPSYKDICAAIPSSLVALRKRNALWTAPTTDSDHWALLALRLPLTKLLSADDQEQAITKVISDGLADLKESGSLSSIVGAASGSKVRNSKA